MVTVVRFNLLRFEVCPAIAIVHKGASQDANKLVNLKPMRIPILLLTAFSLVAATSTRAEEPKPGRQVEMKLELPQGGAVPYLLYLPSEYESKGGPWPLLLFLHGRGESFGPLSLVKKWGPPLLIDSGQSMPWIVASPQCPEKGSWSAKEQQTALVALLDALERNYRVDKNRVYLSGLSMGGYGSWRLAADHPDRFAAVAPVCGGGKPEDAPKLKDLPIWVFHGSEDQAVPFQRSVEMVDAIKKAGGTSVRFTSLEHIGHNSWSAAYATPELYDWFNKQSLTNNLARVASKP